MEFDWADTKGDIQRKFLNGRVFGVIEANSALKSGEIKGKSGYQYILGVLVKKYGDEFYDENGNFLERRFLRTACFRHSSGIWLSTWLKYS